MTGSSGLLPDRHPMGDFFVCDIFGAAPKDDLGSMEHPIFSLSTRPDRRVLSLDVYSRFQELLEFFTPRQSVDRHG